jgi:DNA mismatch endonuclease (patch repair protein)
MPDRKPPPASSTDALRRMTSQRQRDTKREMELRSLLHRRGLRFRVHALLPGLRRRSDIVFTRARVVVFVDGCFWHGCPEHGTWPKQNADWWRKKLEANQRRDRDTDARLRAAGWTVIRVWEHDDPIEAADRVTEVVRQARP